MAGIESRGSRKVSGKWTKILDSGKGLYNKNGLRHVLFLISCMTRVQVIQLTSVVAYL